MLCGSFAQSLPSRAFVLDASAIWRDYRSGPVSRACQSGSAENPLCSPGRETLSAPVTVCLSDLATNLDPTGWSVVMIDRATFQREQEWSMPGLQFMSIIPNVYVRGIRSFNVHL